MSIKAKVVKNRPGFPTGGVLVILVGLIFLLEELGVISKIWGFLWPSVIIVIGLSMLYKHYRA